MPPNLISISNRESLLSSPTFRNGGLSPLQSQVDGLVGGFVEQATDWSSLAAMTAGGMAYRLGRVGALATGTGRLASLGIGLGTEVTAFEMTNRSLYSLNGNTRSNPNLWRWEGQGGIRQGLVSSLVTFGTLKGTGRLAQGENVVVQHLLQDTGMVLGHQVSAAFGITQRPTGSLAEQFLHAEATNLQLGAGMALGHSLTGGRAMALERGLDLSLRFSDPAEEKFPVGQPPDYIQSDHPLFHLRPLQAGAGNVGTPKGAPARSGPSLENIVMSVRSDERADAPEEGIGISGIHVRKTPVRDFSVRRADPSSPDTVDVEETAEIPALAAPTLPARLPSESKPPSSFPLRAALEVSRTRYQTLLKALPDPIIMVDRNGNFLHVHAERDDLLFLPAEEILGSSIRDLPFPTELKEFGMSVIRRALETGEIQRVEYSIPWRDGTTHIQEARVVPDVQPDGSEAALIIVRDITRERRAEESHVAAERLVALQRFSQGIAHDLNNRMTVIENYGRFVARILEILQQLARMASQESFVENPAALRTFQELLARHHRILTRGSKTPEASASQLFHLMALQAVDILERMGNDQGIVVQQSEHIRPLISDLRQLGETPKEGPPFDLHTLLDERGIRAILDRTENLEGQSEELVLDMVADPWLVPGFQGNIFRVIENLVVNARDAMEGRTLRRLTLRTDKVTVTEDDLAQVVYPPIGPNVKPGDYMRLRVEDTGQGIDDTTIRQIFEPFFSTKRRSSSTSSGSGLGLAITLSAIQITRGFITVKSEPDVGTAFEIYLPRMNFPKPDRPTPVRETVPEVPLQERILRTPILIVDDQPEILRINKRILEKEGFQTVLTVESASEALALLEEHPNIGLAILDINLAGMNGVTLMGKLRGLKPNLFCVLSTGNDHAGYAQNIQGGPWLGFLDKPFTPFQVITLTRGMIETSLKNSQG